MRKLFLSAVAAMLLGGPSESRAQTIVQVPDPTVAPEPGRYFQPVYRNFNTYGSTPLYGPNLGFGTFYGSYPSYYGPSRTGISNNSLFPAWEWGRLRKKWRE